MTGRGSSSLDTASPSVSTHAGSTAGTSRIGTELPRSGTHFADLPSSSRADGGFAERAKDVVSSTGATLADAGSSVRARAGQAKAVVADALAHGAERLRASAPPTVAHADASGAPMPSAAATTATAQLASGLQASADWLRAADFDALTSGVEKQVAAHPARTLMVAVGVGYLLGKAVGRTVRS
jgi:hypothetical protein